MKENSNLIINNPKKLEGLISIPGDKSITHRAIMLGALSDGQLKISNSLLSEDCMRTLTAFRELGINIEIDDDIVTIFGKGLNGLSETKSQIDAGNSGTMARLLSGILSTQNFNSSISGDESLVTRPMKRIIEPLESFGALIKSKDEKLPISFKSSSSMKPIKYHSHIPSAQVKSSLILAALYIKGESIISEDVKTRDHTERLLKYMEYPISIDKETVTLQGCENIVAKDIDVPSDISSAAFFIVAALIKKGSDITLNNIGVNSLRTGIIDILLEMGANIKLTNCRTMCNEPVADIKVKYSQLNPINISGDIISRLIDELPILFIACATCNGLSLIKDIHELRYKESDRIEAMENGLKKLGIDIVSTENSIKITGGNFSGGIVDSYGDHRIAMSFLIAGLVSNKPITVLNTSNINTSFPNFENILRNQKIDIYTV
jgi:3-phosphoshikimate 1-carboxyvinyltransferase